MGSFHRNIKETFWGTDQSLRSSGALLISPEILFFAAFSLDYSTVGDNDSER